MAMGVAELKKELQEGVGLLELPEIHQFLDGFYLSRIGIRILIGQHIALHEPEKDNYIGECLSMHAPAAWQHSKLAGHLYMSTAQMLAALLSGAVCDRQLLLKLADSGYHDWLAWQPYHCHLSSQGVMPSHTYGMVWLAAA